jgi:hypothetical protein
MGGLKGVGSVIRVVLGLLMLVGLVVKLTAPSPAERNRRWLEERHTLAEQFRQREQQRARQAEARKKEEAQRRMLEVFRDLPKQRSWREFRQSSRREQDTRQKNSPKKAEAEDPGTL